jgi:hypothetical protein
VVVLRLALSSSALRYKNAVSERLNSRAMVCRVSVAGSRPAGMKTRASGLPLNFVLVFVTLLAWGSSKWIGRKQEYACVV